MSRRQLVPVAIVAIALAAAGCGEEQKDPSAIDGDPTTTLPAALASAGGTTTETTPAKSGPLPKATSVTGVSTDLSSKPAVGKPSGKAPSELQGLDVVTGKGAAVKSGDKVTVQYVGVLFKDGKQFDTSWGKAPFDFTVGQGAVIKGWDDGVPGMKVGGRRVLVIPADLAYGSAGSPPTIPANASLVFVVDLKKIG